MCYQMVGSNVLSHIDHFPRSIVPCDDSNRIFSTWSFVLLWTCIPWISTDPTSRDEQMIERFCKKKSLTFRQLLGSIDGTSLHKILASSLNQAGFEESHGHALLLGMEAQQASRGQLLKTETKQVREGAF